METVDHHKTGTLLILVSGGFIKLCLSSTHSFVVYFTLHVSTSAGHLQVFYIFHTITAEVETCSVK
jgi:hypothetical protein